MKETWAKRLKDRMTGFEQPVDDAVWADIVRGSKPAKARLWPWLTAATASAAAVVAVLLYLHKEPVSEPVVLTTAEDVVHVEATSINSTVADTPQAQSQTQKILSRPDTESALAGTAETSTTGNNATAEVCIQKATDTSNTTEMTSEADKSTSATQKVTYDWESIAEEPSGHNHRITVSTSLYAMTSPFGNRNYMGSLPSTTDPVLPTQPTQPTNPVTEPGYSGETDLPPDDNQDDDTSGTKASGNHRMEASEGPNQASSSWEHSFPVQIGARVSLTWSRRWSIETGLSFMHFNSWTDGRQQQLEYFGAPLYLNYQVGSIHNFAFYTSAGGQAYKCFAGNGPDKPWLFATGIRAGIDYSFSPYISLYAEPGADWYIHTGESRHYYTDNPFAFSMSLGVRFRIKK